MDKERLAEYVDDELETGKKLVKEIASLDGDPKINLRHLYGIPEPTGSDDFVEFLYLNSDVQQCRWGRNGSTNSVFIQGEARDYLRQFF